MLRDRGNALPPQWAVEECENLPQGLKLKTKFCKYSTSIKIKISMSCVYKENEVKIKIVQEQWLRLKIKFLLGYNMKIVLSPRLWNTGLVNSGASLTSWGEGASLALVGEPSSDGVTIKMPYGIDVLHRPASHPIFSYWVG